jgi:hypothetical protein
MDMCCVTARPRAVHRLTETMNPLYLFGLSQFRTEKRFPLFLELL